MRICHVITKPELGGAQLSTLNTLINLPKDKYETFLITSPNGMLRTEFRNLKRVRVFLSPFLIHPIFPIVDILALIHIYNIYKGRKISLVHTHSSKAGIIGRWAAFFYNITTYGRRREGKGCRIVHTVHGWSFNDFQPFILKRFFIFLERLTAKFTTKIICVSKKDIEIGIKYKVAPREKFIFIKYGISLSDFRKTCIDSLEKRKELGINNNDPVVGMISCLKPQKAPLDYIRASIEVYEKMSNINFLLIGDGVLKKRCEKALANSPLNGRFIFTGWIRDISEILDILDVVVLTSKWEGMTIAIIEALCKGCPVVATDVGVKELVKDGITGYLAPVGSYQKIAEGVLRILSDPITLVKMKREASMAIDDSFGLDRMVNELENLYDRLN